MLAETFKYPKALEHAKLLKKANASRYSSTPS